MAVTGKLNFHGSLKLSLADSLDISDAAQIFPLQMAALMEDALEDVEGVTEAKVNVFNVVMEG